MPETLTVALDRDLSAPAHARRAVERFAPCLDAALVGDIKLLVSELITNSVKYGGGGPVRLVLTSEAAEHAHVEVIDHGSGFVPSARARPRSEPGGWGLHMVEALTDRWGVHDGSTHVWFEIGEPSPR